MARRKEAFLSKIELKKWLYRRARGKCHYCTVHLIYGEATLDHKKARSKGGKLNKLNAVLACRKCNAEKADQPYNKYKALWRQRLTKDKDEPTRIIYTVCGSI